MNTDDYIKFSMVGVMVLGMAAVFVNRWRVTNKEGRNVGFSIRSIQFLGVTLIIPAILILALSQQIDKPTLGTLLGTVVGYVLSGIGQEGSS